MQLEKKEAAVLARTRSESISKEVLSSVVEFLKPQETHSNLEERTMRICALALAATILYGLTSFAASTPTAGTIISEKSVECGTKNKGKKTIKSSTALLCQQYVVHTATTEYEIREPKPSNQAIIPATSAIQFAINKNKMKFKLNGKSYEFLIVGTSAITPER